MKYVHDFDLRVICLLDVVSSVPLTQYDTFTPNDKLQQCYIMIFYTEWACE